MLSPAKENELAGIHTYIEETQAAETQEAQTSEETEETPAETASQESETQAAEESAADETQEVAEESTEAAVDTSLNGTQAFAQCEEYINVRSGADTNSEVVGKVYNNGSVTILGQVGDWYEVQSGNVTGYVSADYFATGSEAEAIADEVGYNVATVHPEALMIRSQPSEDSEAIGMAENSDQLEVVAYEGDWMKVALDADTFGYVNAYYVDYDTYYSTAETLEEEQARLDQQWLDYLAEQEAEQRAAEEAYLAAIAEQEAQAAAAEQAAADAAAQAAAAQQAAAEQAAAEQAAADQQAQNEAQATADAQAQADAAYQEYLNAQAAADAATQQADEQAVIDAGGSGSGRISGILKCSGRGRRPGPGRSRCSSPGPGGGGTSCSRAGSGRAGSSRTGRSRAGGGRTGSSGAGSSRTGRGRRILYGYFHKFFSWTGDCELRPAVCWKSLCMGRHQPDKRSGLLRIHTVCLRELRNWNSPYGGVSVRQRYSVSLDSLQAGDLIFYGDGGISHVALYIGGGQVVHASSSTTGNHHIQL